MRFYTLIFWGLSALTCSADNGLHSLRAKGNYDTVKVILLEGSINKLKHYRLLDLRDTVKNTHELQVLKDSMIIGHIVFPGQDDYNSFSFDTINKTPDGFDISMEYGSRIYYRKTFQFYLMDGDFYL